METIWVFSISLTASTWTRQIASKIKPFHESNASQPAEREGRTTNANMLTRCVIPLGLRTWEAITICIWRATPCPWQTSLRTSVRRGLAITVSILLTITKAQFCPGMPFSRALWARDMLEQTTPQSVMIPEDPPAASRTLTRYKAGFPIWLLRLLHKSRPFLKASLTIRTIHSPGHPSFKWRSGNNSWLPLPLCLRIKRGSGEEKRARSSHRRVTRPRVVIFGIRAPGALDWMGSTTPSSCSWNECYTENAFRYITNWYHQEKVEYLLPRLSSSSRTTIWVMRTSATLQYTCPIFVRSRRARGWAKTCYRSQSSL